MQNIHHDPDFKIKMTFRKDTLSVITADARIFGIPISKVIERCIETYCEESKSKKLLDLEKRGSNKKHGLDIIEALFLVDDMFFKKNIINLIVKSNYDIAADKKNISRRKFPKNTSVVYVWSPTKIAIDALLADKRTDGETVSLIRDLLEEYSELPFGKRERIILRKQIKFIEDAIVEQKPFEYVTIGGVPTIMHPYKIKTDPYLQYNYVIGHGVFTSKYNPDTFVPTNDNIRNIRLFNLKERPGIGKGWIKVLEDETSNIDESALINREALVPYGFFSENLQNVTVEMNAEGVRLFRKLIHNRPKIKETLTDDYEGFKTYTCICTIFQAVIYFINFEEKARITSPPEAVDAIKAKLSKALGMY